MLNYWIIRGEKNSHYHLLIIVKCKSITYVLSLSWQVHALIIQADASLKKAKDAKLKFHPLLKFVSDQIKNKKT